MNNWITINTFTYPHEAHMAKNYVESEGVQVELQDEMITQVNNFYSHAVSGIKFNVQEKDSKHAYQLLIKGGYIISEKTKHENRIEIVSIHHIKDKKHCPFCHSENMSKRKRYRGLAAFMYLILSILFIFGIPFLFMNKSYICYDCEKGWKYSKKGKS